MPNLEINDRVIVIGKNVSGTIAFKGKTKFSSGMWFGIILDEPNGRKNGSCRGIRYFKCFLKYGIFVRENQIRKLSKKAVCYNSKIDYPNYLQRKSAKNDLNYSSGGSFNDVVDNSLNSVNSKSSLDFVAAKYIPLVEGETLPNNDINAGANLLEHGNETGDGKKATVLTNNASNTQRPEDFTTLLNKAIEEQCIFDIKVIKKEEVKLVETEEYIENFKKKFSLE